MEQSNIESKYQYHMFGMFKGTDGNFYDIDIPVPFLYDSEEKAIKSWVEGEVLATYSFQEFIKAGGKMRMLKPEHQGAHLEEEDFIDTENNFADCFPAMEPCKLYYIDSEAYYIKKIQ